MLNLLIDLHINHPFRKSNQLLSLLQNQEIPSLLCVPDEYSWLNKSKSFQRLSGDSKANEYLVAKGIDPVDWSLPAVR